MLILYSILRGDRENHNYTRGGTVEPLYSAEGRGGIRKISMHEITRLDC